MNGLPILNIEFAGAVLHLSSKLMLLVRAFTSLHIEDMKVTTEFMPAELGSILSYGDVALLQYLYSRKMTAAI